MELGHLYSICSVSTITQSCYQKDANTFIKPHVFFEMDACLLEAGQIAYSFHIYYSTKWKWLAFTIDLLGILANNQATKSSISHTNFWSCSSLEVKYF